MIVKPYITFLSRVSDAELISIVNGIVSGLKDNPHFPTPTPALPVVAAALDEFAQALSDAAQGGITFTALKNAKRQALVTLMRQLAIYVEVTCQGNMAVLLSSGFPTHKPERAPSRLPAVPENLRVTLGARTGELNAVVASVAGAACYNWQLSTAAEPDVVLQLVHTTAARNTFTGLTPGVVYRATVNAFGSAGPSDWASPVLQMVV
ncbi:MAG: hypothetical protein RLY20_1126 [Verrucomicrobiota bacterium]|jgi:hypothetical protein